MRSSSTPREVFCKDFVDISHENASFLILEDSLWLQLIYFLTTNAKIGEFKSDQKYFAQ